MKTKKTMSDKMSITLINEADAITYFIGFLLREVTLLKGADPSAFRRQEKGSKNPKKDLMQRARDAMKHRNMDWMAEGLASPLVDPIENSVTDADIRKAAEVRETATNIAAVEELAKKTARKPKKNKK